jgi:hypothetical protein
MTILKNLVDLLAPFPLQPPSSIISRGSSRNPIHNKLQLIRRQLSKMGLWAALLLNQQAALGVTRHDGFSARATSQRPQVGSQVQPLNTTG